MRYLVPDYDTEFDVPDGMLPGQRQDFIKKKLSEFQQASAPPPAQSDSPLSGIVKAFREYQQGSPLGETTIKRGLLPEDVAAMNQHRQAAAVIDQRQRESMERQALAEQDMRMRQQNSQANLEVSQLNAETNRQRLAAMLAPKPDQKQWVNAADGSSGFANLTQGMYDAQVQAAPKGYLDSHTLRDMGTYVAHINNETGQVVRQDPKSRWAPAGGSGGGASWQLKEAKTAEDRKSVV